MRIIIFLVCCTCSYFTYAQTPHVLSLYDNTLKDISLDFNITSVIDGRKNQNNIGWVQTGMTNKRRDAVLSLPLEKAVMDMIQRSKLTSTGNLNAILRIDHFYVSEQTRAMSETAKAEVTITLFIQNPDTTYSIIGNYHASFESKGADVTKHHPTNLTIALANTLKQCSKVELESGRAHQRYTQQDIIHATSDKINVESMPIVKADSYKSGIYTNLSEFRDNNPSVTEGYEVSEGKNLKVRWTDGGKVNKNVFAVAHSNKLYIFFHNGFYPVERKNHEFYFTGPRVPNQQDVFVGGLLGGLVGGAIAASGGESTTYQIDLATGALIPQKSSQ